MMRKPKTPVAPNPVPPSANVIRPEGPVLDGTLTFAQRARHELAYQIYRATHPEPHRAWPPDLPGKSK